MSDLGRDVLSYIFPSNREGLQYVLDRLTPEHFAGTGYGDQTQRTFYRILESFAERYNDVVTGEQLVNVLKRNGVKEKNVLLYTETYNLFVQREVSESQFHYAVDGLLDDHNKRLTGDAIARAYAVLERGEEVDGTFREGWKDASEVLTERLATIQDSVSTESTPEGDMRLEGDSILAHYEQMEQSEELPGMMFGISSLDANTSGIQPGEFAIIAAYTNEGKASPLWTPVLTPSGWSKMGDLQPGDFVIGSNGRPTEVLQVYDRGIMDTFRVTFGDASVVTAGDHLWQVQDQNQRAGKTSGHRVLSTNSLAVGQKEGRRYYVPLVSPVEFPVTNLPLDPYALGVILGDGCVSPNQHPSITCHPEDTQIIRETGLEVRQSSHRSMYWSILGIKGLLDQIGVYGFKSYEKSIPEIYLTSSVEQRLSLLQGLMDADGYVGRKTINFDSTSLRLAMQVRELVQSLGGTARLHSERFGVFEGVQHRQSYRLGIKMPLTLCPFRLDRKVKRWNLLIKNLKAAPVRCLRSVEKLVPEPVRCISVAAEDSLYVTEDYLVTHNSQFAAQLAWNAAVKQGKNVYFATTETVRDTTMRRLIARHSREPQFGLPRGLNVNDIKRGSLSPDEKAAFHDVVKDFTTNDNYASCYIAQMPRNATINYLDKSAQRADRKAEIGCVVVDYLQLFKAIRARQSEREEYNELLRDGKVWANTFGKGRGVALITPWQMRQEEYKVAAKAGAYTLSSLSDTSEAEKTPDIIIALLRPQGPTSNEGIVQILKNRDGPTMGPSPVHLDYRCAYIGETASQSGSEGIDLVTGEVMFDIGSLLA